ncbi:hypothetical protein SCP_1501050 [Sparassis crispa]|uniref:Protein kinase domain-containing protein n=1 Tax=Sparassis crispa TaxID=139825 RepID=A0A401H3W3_9APHY|nr:hypothetical protein SCP_1501050 [Sparassis crispa]GBE89102.1 hypothetical protein SCP_1501050 [Sparassis crispa]
MGCKGHPSYDVFCKVVLGKRAIARLREEAEVYFRLCDLQGDVVPVCYKLFEGELADGPSACLITEYRGESLDRYMRTTSWRFRCQVIKALADIHACGIQNCDFDVRNIVVDKDGRPFIIDFDRAQRHECTAPEIISVGVPAPFLADFGCDEIWSFCQGDCGMWKPNTFPFMGGHLALCYFESVGTLASKAPKGTPRDVALEEARRAIERFQRSK